MYECLPASSKLESLSSSDSLACRFVCGLAGRSTCNWLLDYLTANISNGYCTWGECGVATPLPELGSSVQKEIDQLDP